MYKSRGFSIIFVLILSLLSALISGIAVYYFSVGKYQVEKKNLEEELDKLKDSYEKLRVENEQLKALSKDETENWKTFSSKEYGYSIKYPSLWVYKDYGKLEGGSKMVTFAPDVSDLPPENSDQPAIISININNKPLSSFSLSQCPQNVKKESITIGEDISAIKWVVPAGCSEDMFGEFKITTIEIKKSQNKFINIENFNDKELEIFEKMLKTFKLI